MSINVKRKGSTNEVGVKALNDCGISISISNQFLSDKTCLRSREIGLPSISRSSGLITQKGEHTGTLRKQEKLTIVSTLPRSCKGRQLPGENLGEVAKAPPGL